MANWDTYKQKLLKDPEFKKIYDESSPEFEIARAIIRGRIKNKITQKELAKRMNTTQSVISRVEQARTSPFDIVFEKVSGSAEYLTSC